MSRNRFVQPVVVRLPLVDVHRRALDTLKTKGKPLIVGGIEVKADDGTTKMIPATAQELMDAESAIAQAAIDADWIDVKAELNAGETRRVFTDLVKEMTQGSRAILDPRQVGLTKILQYVMGWSFLDAHGQPVQFSKTALESLDTDSYREIDAAVDWHDENVAVLQAARKNAQAPANVSVPT